MDEQLIKELGQFLVSVKKQIAELSAENYELLIAFGVIEDMLEVEKYHKEISGS